ncbi:DUF2971 domain-containing protein [Microbacterium sp. NPDC087589]|uniref:DUF2971 domain-containing protein n=1 Tax=Microbacterium sp. NPDC087589 TaxID=3364191 RepID=UPI003803A0C3
MKSVTEYGLLKTLLEQQPSVYLYHYTGPAGAIGILKSKKLWAGRPADMNDSTEQVLAQQYAQQELRSLSVLEGSFGEAMVEYALELLQRPNEYYLRLSRVYTVSLTSERDSLEQWRAYCPRSGGVALGFRSDHLRNVASDQGFILAPCIYDEDVHERMVTQIVEHHLRVWSDRRSLELPSQGLSSHLVHDFINDLERLAPLIKHSSFRAEREWRLISPHVSEASTAGYVHIAGETGIRQFREFNLLTENYPTIPDGEIDPNGFPSGTGQGLHPVIGPSLDPLAMEEALRALAPEEFGWMYSVGRTTSPYR